ncbi:M48 family metallopeptidase [Chitinimonas lacunae]|uniref:M48 family metallopeptidase n=1 Tax=Chitinimonas lacunae TaxID=1963018 RepID=A0ABV8MT49_9NEIS
MSHLSRLAAALAAVLLVAGCEKVQTTEGGAVGVEREQRMFSLLSTEQVEGMAAQAYEATLSEARAQGRLNDNPPQTDRVRAIARRLIPQVEVYRRDALNWKWEVNVEDSPELNAYCAPGGKIMFFDGIIERLKLSDDEIAAIMGHEMAHALREHGRERMSKIYGQQLLAQGVSLVTGGKYDNQINIALDVTQLAYNLPNSREHEKEADAIGLELAARAGYDPRAAISLWQKMSQASQGQPPQFLSTHPSHATRIEELQAKMPIVLPLYEAARQQRS